MASTSGLVPLDGDVNIGPGFAAATTVLVGVSVIFVILRLVTRIKIVRSLWWDDYTIVFAIVCSIQYITISVLLIYGTK